MFLVTCDGPDIETATCVGVEASGLVVVGAQAFTPAQLGAVLSAIGVVFAIAFGIRAILRTINAT